jgi:hypothetical protein
MGGTVTFDQLVAEGKARLEGDRAPLDLLRGAMVRFTPGFELVPGTLPAAARAQAGPAEAFDVPEPAKTSGGN